ncbi:NADP-dependent oxidoreductase [Sphingobium sufflavum]|uniref:NADP-dependent oxidoreductase n=1 Tax=Sphingobium sufflavum TaxID=1129547 RepID=UPI001F2AFAF3|nr:NADP-dependent oxidoreductase [Sphingobium sufflavum]MCE7795432.1 NADP-dependent oxidoreductase [Sphingobium sufflavum]
MKQIILRAHPQGRPRADDFAVEEVPTPVPGPGEILVRTLWLSLDPLIRFALDETVLTGAARVALGEPVYGGTVSRVVESHHADYAVGDLVEVRSGWREYAVVDPAQQRMGFRRIDPAAFASPNAPLSAALGIIGMPGQTAHSAVEIGRVAAGETVVISAAAGAVGTIAGQIAKMRGARVVGIAGGPAKCRAVEAIGYDACVDYKAPDFEAQLAAAVPDKVDVYIDNVGGDVTMKVLPHLKMKARMPVVGFISYYGDGMEAPGPDRMPGFLRFVMSRSLEVRGFAGQMTGGQKALDDLAQWVADGKIRSIETVVDGLDNAGTAFADKFGRNDQIGKLVVRVGKE